MACMVQTPPTTRREIKMIGENEHICRADYRPKRIFDKSIIDKHLLSCNDTILFHVRCYCGAEIEAGFEEDWKQGFKFVCSRCEREYSWGWDRVEHKRRFGKYLDE